jgi:hypothetical protein
MAAALFGASTPFAKVLLGEVHPVLLAGLLYAGSGAGLAIVQVLRMSFMREGGALFGHRRRIGVGLPLRSSLGAFSVRFC